MVGGHPFRHLLRWLGTMWRRFAPSKLGIAHCCPFSRQLDEDRFLVRSRFQSRVDRSNCSGRRSHKVHRSFHSAVPCPRGDGVGIMRIATVARLVRRKTTFELFVRIVRAVLIFDQIKDQFVGDCAHSAVPPLRFPTATTQSQELPSLRQIWGVEAQPRSTTYPLYGSLRILPMNNYFFVNTNVKNGLITFRNRQRCAKTKGSKFVPRFAALKSCVPFMFAHRRLDPNMEFPLVRP